MNRHLGGSSPVGRRQVALSGFWFQDVALSQFLDLAVASGFDSVGLWSSQYSVGVDQLRESLESRGVTAYCLNVSSGGPRLNTPDLEEVQQAQVLINAAIDIAEELSVPVVQTYCAPGADLPGAAMIARYSQQLQPCVSRAAAAGIRITVENNLDRRAEDPLGCNPSRRHHSLRALVDSVGSPAFGITFDPCNFLITGEDSVAAYRALRDAIVCVEFKDARKAFEDADDPKRALIRDSVRGTFQVLPIGLGDVDFPSLLPLLRSDNYRGPFVLDPYGEGEFLDKQLAVGAPQIRAWSLEVAPTR